MMFTTASRSGGKRAEKRSELWQRLRAARAHAQLSQQQMATKLKGESIEISRAGVALWESRDPKPRTTPSLEQVKAYARVCGIAADFLTNDDNEPDALSMGTYGAKPAEAPAPGANREIRRVFGAHAEMQSRAFWQAVKFNVLMSRPELHDGFDADVAAAGLHAQADFMQGALLCAFERADDSDALARAAARMLFIEKAAQAPLRKHLLVFSAVGDIIPAGAAQQVQQVFGIRVAAFSNIDKAAAYLVGA